jgi:hypothetical protein
MVVPAVSIVSVVLVVPVVLVTVDCSHAPRVSPCSRWVSSADASTSIVSVPFAET